MTISFMQLKLPTPTQAIAWGLLPHCLGIAQHILGSGTKAAKARLWLSEYVDAGGYVGDIDVLLGWYGPEFALVEGEAPMFLGDTEVSSADAVKLQKQRGTCVLRALETAATNGRPLWRVLLEESSEGYAVRRFVANYMARGGEIGFHKDFLRSDKVSSGVEPWITDIAKGGKPAGVARNLIALVGTAHDRTCANLDAPIGDVGAFEEHQHRLMRTFHVLPDVKIIQRSLGVLDNGGTLGMEELHIMAHMIEQDRRHELQG